jgi:hypothetical protein
VTAATESVTAATESVTSATESVTAATESVTAATESVTAIYPRLLPTGRRRATAATATLSGERRLRPTMNVRDVLPRDAIPSVDDPTFREGYDGAPEDTLLVVESAPPRGYPTPVLNYHEVVNDVVDGDPLGVTWCPLCGSGVVYDRTVDGRTLTFGVSGKLADDDLVLYDRETDSEWKQSTGECIAGEFEGRRLAVRSATVTTAERFRESYPDGVVLEAPGGESEAASDDDAPAPIDYDQRPYERYVEGEGFGLDAHRGGEGRAWGRDDLDPKAVVLGVVRDGEALGFPRERVRDEGGAVSATVDGEDVVVFATDDGIHAYADPGFAFEPTDDPGAVAGDGTRWNGTTGRSADGRELARVPARRLYAFTWQDDHGPDAFYG